MGVDTNAYIINIDINKLYDFLNIIFKDVKIKDTHYNEYKTISFNNRTLHVHDIYIDIDKEKQEYIKKGWSLKNTTESEVKVKKGLPNKTKGLYLSLNLWGNSIKIMEMICYYFGGYILENDIRDSKYSKIEKNHRKIVKIIFEGDI